MSTTDYQAMNKPVLMAQDSTVVLEGHRDSRASSTSGEAPPSTDVDNEIPPVTLGLSVRRGRLVTFTVVMVAIIAGLTVALHHGLELATFEGSDKDATQRSRLLNDYNSYSGNVASIFGKPIEFFVTVSAQVIVLQFMATTISRSGSSWKVSGATLGLGVLVGYLISNGFNAVNVQFHELDVKPRISEADLSVVSDAASSNAAWPSTNDSFTISEMRPGNSVSNTMLRNVVQPFKPKEATYCTGMQSTNATIDEVPDIAMVLGFPQREWQSKAIATAITPMQLRLVVNPTDATANAGVRSADLPMNASLAADLFVYSMLLGPWFFPWGKTHDYVNRTDLDRRYPETTTNTILPNAFDSAAKIDGLLPTDNRNESAQREWFLKESVAAVARQFNQSTNTSQSDIAMAFSHVDVAPGVTFDAVTFEVEMEPMLIPNTYSVDNKTRYTVLKQYAQCGPASGHCMLPKSKYSVQSSVFDPPAQVMALAMCGDKNGKEGLNATYNPGTEGNLDHLYCWYGSTTSMLVVSIGKRLVADSLEQNMTANVTGKYVNTLSDMDLATAVATNVRKIYTFTVGRVAWKPTNLSSTFNAECGASETGCLGVLLPLGASAEDGNVTKQYLLAGSSTTPTLQLELPGNPDYYKPRFRSLLALTEPARAIVGSSKYDILAGDVLLPHNVANVSWATTKLMYANCDPQVEERLQQTLDNHFYMEHSLQPAYTAGLFFLLQNGAVKDVVKLQNGLETLNFVNNSQPVAVWVSTPDQNAWLTLGGCIVLVVGLVAAALKAAYFTSQDSDPLAKITDPHTIARVMLDDKQFPPLLLHRDVVDPHEGTTRRPIANFEIESLSLQQSEDGQGSQVTKVV